MYLIVSEYFDRRMFKRTIWWGKSGHHQICGREGEPTERWKIDNAINLEKHAESKADKLPTDIWIDGRAFTLDNSVIVSVEGE